MNTVSILACRLAYPTTVVLYYRLFNIMLYHVAPYPEKEDRRQGTLLLAVPGGSLVLLVLENMRILIIVVFKTYSYMLCKT